MTRREAIAALTMLPEVTRVSVAKLRPTDVIVVETSQLLSLNQCEGLKQTLGSVWPGHKIVVCECGLTIRVIEEEPR